jgi:hypothetical protein
VVRTRCSPPTRAISCVCSASAHACILRNAEAHQWVQGWRSPRRDSKQRTVFKVRSVSLPRIVNCCNSARGCVTLWPGTSSSLALSPPLPALKACVGPSVLATFPFQAKISPLFRFAPPSTKSRCICAAASVNGHQPSSAPPVPQHFLAPLLCNHSLFFLITFAFTVGRGRKFKNSPATPQARGSKEF